MTIKEKKSASQSEAQVASAVSRSYDEAASAGKETLEAMLKANAALAGGMERIGQEMIGLTRQSLESVAAASSALLDARSIEDVVAVQSNFAKALVERLLTGTVKLSELSLQAASEAYDPLGERVEQTLAHLTKPLAA